MPHPKHRPRNGCTATLNLALPLSVVVVSIAVLFTVLLAPQPPATGLVGSAATTGAPALPEQPPANQIRLQQYDPPGTNTALALTQTAYPYPYPGLTPTVPPQPTDTATPQPATAVPGGGGGGAAPTSTPEPAVEPTDTPVPLPTVTPLPPLPTSTSIPTETPVPNFFTCIPGETIELVGENAPPNTPLIVFFNGFSIGGGVTDRNGRYSIRVRIGPERPDIYLLEIKTRERRILIREAACIVPEPTPGLLPNATRAP